jgi:EmrB/QacA subfamily drug resistance transporter
MTVGATPARRGAGTAGHAGRWTILVLVGLGNFITALDGSIVNIGLPSIARSFGVPLSGPVEWVVIAYLVVVAGLLVTFGRLADIVGRQPVWAAGLAIFGLGSVACGMAPSLGWLVAARAAQGVGAALVSVPSLAMIADSFPSSERGRAIGANAVVVALATSAGPTIGGLITEHWGWRWIFYVNVPICLMGLLTSFRVLPRAISRAGGRFDPAGALLFAVGLGALTLGLSFGSEWGWASWRLIGCLGLAVSALGAAVIVERRVHDPIIDLGLLRNRVFASALFSFVLCMLALFAVSFLLPFYLEELHGFSTAEAGLLLTPLPLAIAVVAPLSGSLADRFGSRWLAPGGLAVACLGLLLLAQLGPDSSTWDLIWRLIVTGIGQGLFQSPNNRAMMAATPTALAGVASGLQPTARVVGQVLSVALAGAIFTSLGGARAGSALIAQAQDPVLPMTAVSLLQLTFAHAFHAALLVCAIVAAAGILVALVRGSEAESSARPSP